MGGRRARVVLATLAITLILGGCASGEEPPPAGADGSGDLREVDRLTATLKDADGEAVGRAQAEADGDAVRLRVQVGGVEPGSYRVALGPGATCDDDVRRRAGLPRLVVAEDGSGSLDATVAKPAFDDLAEGTALRLSAGPTWLCGVLADY